jgi:DNA-directed RNA polymerase specialized sigma24 family protein
LLPVPRQNAILELIYIQGFTLAEAAGRLNIPVETAKLQIIIAIKHLKTRVSV